MLQLFSVSPLNVKVTRGMHDANVKNATSKQQVIQANTIPTWSYATQNSKILDASKAYRAPIQPATTHILFKNFVFWLSWAVIMAVLFQCTNIKLWAGTESPCSHCVQKHYHYPAVRGISDTKMVAQEHVIFGLGSVMDQLEKGRRKSVASLKPRELGEF